ncbi:hypothetical protein Tco_1081260 [Tanacetum coccineum]|uniref:Transposase (putative) gypsy type domain-containing protein n=1 Tax=Tanacetum coccineum TaxID=301880 RepID=A0ABQ5HYJ5_9ASTR
MPTGKIGVYTRFFEYANFRLPLSTFLVNVLRHYHIHISQLSVIGAAKVSHFEILCRVHGFEPTVGLFHSLKSWNDRFFWVDAFSCPASFPWNSSKSVSKDPFPKSSEFNAEHYATLVAYPAPFHKYLEPFLWLIGISHNYTLDEDTYPQFLCENREEMDLLSFIQTVDPTKVRVGERQHAEDEPKLLDTTMGCVVPLLPIALAHAESELDASVDRLFDEGGSGNLAEQGDSVSGGHVVGILLVSEAAETVVEDVAPLPPKRQRKRKMIVSDASGPSHLPKKLREDHGTSTGSSVAERESEDQTDSMAGANLRTITAPPRFVISSDSSHHSGANIAEAEVDSFAMPSIPLMTVATIVTFIVDPATTIKEKFVESSVFCGDSFGGGADHTVGGFSDLIGSDFIVGGIHTVISPDTDLQKVYVLQWNGTNGFRLDDGRSCSEMVNEFAPPKFFASIRGMDHNQLFTEFNVGAGRQISLSAEVSMRAEYNIRERMRLNSAVEEKTSLLKARDAEIKSLKAQLLVKEAEAAEAIRLRVEASKFEAIEKSLQGEVRVLKDYNTTLEKEKSELDVKVADLVASVKVREQEADDLDVMVTSVKSQNDSLVDQVHELETSSAELQEKFAAYENCMGKLEEFQNEPIRVMNDKFEKLYVDFVEMALHLEEKFYPRLLTTIAGHRWLLTYGVKLAIVKCLHSPEYLSALGVAINKAIVKGMQDGLAAGITHELQDVNFSLLAELKSNKDASTETLMNILRLDEPLAERLGLDESQPHVDQLHNIANHRSALRDVFVPLVEPLSSTALEGMEGTSGTAPETTTALSVTFASTCSIPPISRDDYDVHADGQEGTDADGQAGAGVDVNPFHNVEDAKLDIS